MPRIRKRICIVVSTIITAEAFLRDQLIALSELHDVVVVANEKNPGALRVTGVPLDIVYLPIVREIAPLVDAKALFLLYRYLRREKFDLIHSVTPKAGLLAALAGWCARSPMRVHTYTGQVWATRKGFMRALLKGLDKLIARLNQRTLADSASQKEFLVAEGVVRPNLCTVPAMGSISGVDIDRFRPDTDKRAEIRNRLGLTESDVLFLFLGRLNPDKGLLDLAKAFLTVRTADDQVFLLVAGPDEANMSASLKEVLSTHPTALFLHGFTREPEQFMRAADVFCLPSYREGFGTVIIEAAACGVPAVASRIYGLTDAVEDGVTGLLHEPGNIRQIATALTKMATDHTFRKSAGEQALERARRQFSMPYVTGEMLALYEQYLTESSA